MPPDPSAASASPPPLLRVAGLEAGYGRVQVLWGVDVTVRARECVVVLGANGAGKTTLLKAIVGLVPAWRGTVELEGEAVTHLRTDRRVRRGIVYMSEACGFPGLTVEENLRVGAHALPRRAVRARIEEQLARFPALAQRRRALASSLSGGQRKLLGLAKALAGQPRIVIADEPSAGLSPVMVTAVIQALRELHRDGLALLVAEQNVKFLQLAERVTIVDGGRIGFTGTVEAMRQDDAVRRAYFGLR